MESLKIHDKKFSETITAQKIQTAVEKIAAELNRDFKEREVVFIAVLNGSFMFASDLLKRIDLNCKISFVKVASYDGTVSKGVVNQLIGLNESIKNKAVVILEDIVDTGNTLHVILNYLQKLKPQEIKIASLLNKPDSYKYEYKLHYVGFYIPDKFVVGYGLDYNGFGRNLRSIYTIIEES